MASINALPAQVCERIVRWARRSDLVSLCLTCKALQREAEVKLYEIIMSGNTQVVFRACQSIISRARLGPYVRALYIFQNNGHCRSALPEDFWGVVQLALSTMRSLQCLVIHDPTYSNGWVLSDISHIPFQLQEARLFFYWDRNFVRFLESQNQLKSLHIVDGPDNDSSLKLEVGSLPELQVFDGILMAAEHIIAVTTSITHLQVALDTNSEADFLTFIPKLARLTSLGTLSILHLPEYLAARAFPLIAATCCTLRHIGMIPLPLPGPNSNYFYRALLSMHQLRVLEVNTAAWTPQPTGIQQRILASEIRVYCPSIEYVCFWTGGGRTLWILDGNDWSYHSDNAHHLQLDALWKAR
ncbi:hypothetical protein EDC04DRAFT_2565716 [Pisolithus marmoratus]|nr:hypothetical protein EDC04DRAFT_2565716 [Pisolithus marmoratus]